LQKQVAGAFVVVETNLQRQGLAGCVADACGYFEAPLNACAYCSGVISTGKSIVDESVDDDTGKYILLQYIIVINFLLFLVFFLFW
jgi:hypothetical protein